MEDNFLEKIEQQIEDLIQLCQHLQNENDELRFERAKLKKEQRELLEKNQLAANHIRKVVNKLKRITERK